MNRKILLVEDNPDDAKLTVQAFKQHNLSNDSSVVPGGAAAIDYLFGPGRHAGREASDLPAVGFSDLKRPKPDGLEVRRRIRADPRTTTQPVVVLTSLEEEQDLIASDRLGANSDVRTPADFEPCIEAARNPGRYWLAPDQAPPKFLAAP